MDPAELVDRLWRTGAGGDDGAPIAAALGAVDADSDAGRALIVFGEWISTGTGSASTKLDPAAIADAATRVVARATVLRAACNRRDAALIDAALVALDRDLPTVAQDGGRDATARAAADLALAEAAIVGKDLDSARRCLERIAGTGPEAFRIAALMRQASMLLSRPDLQRARTRARQALTLATAVGREAQAVEARILLGLISYMVGDVDAMRATLAPALEGADGGGLARVLAASLEPPERSLPILAEGMKRAAQTGDAVGYVICALVGARRYLEIGRRGDALITLIAARVRLEAVAAGMVQAIDDELAAYRGAWGDAEFAAAEREAIAILDGG